VKDEEKKDNAEMSAEKKEEKPAEDETLPGLDDQPSKTDEEMTNEEAK